MTFFPFDMERLQSTWEHRVRFNLSESGVQPLTVRELLGLAGSSTEALLDVSLGYSQSNGTDELRRRVAALYPGASPDQVVVTSGSSEANFVSCWRIIEPGDDVAVLLPTYMQAPGLARNFGAEVRPFFLHAERAWEPHEEEIHRAVGPGTRLVVVTNPNNPTGHVLSDTARRLIVSRAAEVGAWILADEVYRGAERDGQTTPSFWGSYDKLVVTSGLSKAYGLPGLRIGWVVSTPAFAAEAWARHDYTTICPSAANDHLATIALEPGVRDKILERTRRILNTNYPMLDAWLTGIGAGMTWRVPEAGAVCFVRYPQAIAASQIVARLRVDHSVLLVPGEHFGMPGCLRFGYGGDLRQLEQALAETERGLRRMLVD
jgi:aspartate/methionine/tyrosine aminotransferase